MAIKQIVYVSEQAVEFDRLRLVALLEKSRTANRDSRITGALLYAKGRFAQCIEGEDGAVDTLYAKIRADRRHVNVVTLNAMPLPARSFEGWTMACADVVDSELLNLQSSAWIRVLERQRAGGWMSPGNVLMEAWWSSYRASA